MNRTDHRKVLVSGASIAGPALAYWLRRLGFEVTVVEKASAPRTGGYPIDIRGTALEVVRRMGLLPRLREAHIDLRRITFVEGDGAEVASLRPYTLTGSREGRDLEIARGDLTEALYAAVRDDVEFVFEDSISALHQHDHGVDVTFRSGVSRSFDLVVGADGAHSRTREIVFGQEERFHRYLGYRFGVFTTRNDLGLSHEAVIWNTPGKAAALYAPGDGEVHAFLALAQPDLPDDSLRDPAAQHALLATSFAGAGWEVPGILAALRDSGDLFFDAVGQIRMSRWSYDRVVLVGDAAYAPSFLSGQGTSLALVGAYMLAHSLAGRDHADGFVSYERSIRDFVSINQALVDREGGDTLFPVTAEDLARRNNALRAMKNLPRAEERPAYTAMTLPEFEPAS